MQSDEETIPLLPIGRRGKAIYIVLSHDPSVSDLRIVMLVEQRADDVVDELVLAVEHVQREGRHEADETDDNELLYELEYEFPELFHVLSCLSQYAMESSNSTMVGSRGFSLRTTDM